MDRRQLMAIILLLSLLSGILSGCSANEPGNHPAVDSDIENEIEQIAVSGELPSLQVSVIDQNQIVWSKTYGADIGDNFAYMNGSVQKVVDATAVLQLYEKGLIELDADINHYIPFKVKHPDYPDIPITIRMLLSHRSGLDAVRDQFSWDTECQFLNYRPNCNFDSLQMSLEEYLIASFTPGGSNYNPNMWINQPGEAYHYSVSAYPLLRYLIEQVSGEPYPAYMQEHIFEPLEMWDTGFVLEDLADQHAVPHTRINGENVELPFWNGNGYMMRTTAEDMAKFMLVHINKGSYNQNFLLQPETIELMQTKTSKGKSILNRNTELTDAGYGLGLIHYKNGWLGHGGSTVGYQSLWQFNPTKQCGYVILTNVNGILGGRDDFMSVWENVAEIRDILLKQLDPLSKVRTLPWEWVLLWVAAAVLINLIPRLLRRQREEKILPLTRNY